MFTMCRHLWHGLVVVAALGGCTGANPLVSWDSQGNASMSGPRSEHLILRDIVEFDETDLSFITTMAAIGDSYSAGIGAGDRLGNIGEALQSDSDWACSRYDHAYPYLVNNDERLGDPTLRTFQFESCSGAVIADVISNQIPNIDANQQVILISAGGNDVQLSNILNQCIFQWAVLNSEQVAVAKAAALLDPNYEWANDFDWDSIGLGCDGQLALTATLIAGDAFGQNLDSLITAAKAKLGPTGMIYYTGYAKFWAEDLSPDCDSVTWTTWIYTLYNLFQPTQTLTTAHRTTMNQLVDAANAQISAAVDRAGSSVTFVDYDSYVGYFNGRFCEAGVDESTTASNTRTGLMFYELNTWDPAGTTPWKRSTDDPLNGTFEGTLNQFAQITLLTDPNAQFTDQALVDNDTAAATVGVSELEVEIPNLLPDGYGRVFHPQILLHEVISSLIIYEMVSLNEQNNGFPAIAEDLTFDSCPYYPPSSSSNSTNGTAGGGGQQIGLASYINPLADPDSWDRMIDYPADKVSVLIANVLNGPDTTVDPDWQSVISRAFFAGKRVIGYVRTGYLGVSEQQFQTRLGSTDLADWVSQIQTDVDLWYQLYPGMIGGIFFDEGWNECGPDNQYSNLYQFISDTTKRKYPGAYTVLNPGATMPQCFENSADTLMTFESDYSTYTNDYVPNPGWTPSDPRKIWHIIYNTPAGSAAEVAALALERGAGFVDITDGILPNPYDTLPADDYMQTLMNAVDGGSPLLTDPLPFPASGEPASQPGSLSVTSYDYSSVSLSWEAPSSDAPYAFVVFLSDKEVVRLPGTMSQVTVGNIEPGSTSLSFTLRAMGWDGSETGDSNSAIASTLSLPNGQAVANISASPSSTSTTVQADVFVPYAFVRVFLTDPDTKCSLPAWPINYDAGDFICTHYMVEGEALYQYSGANLTGTETDYAWTWTWIGYAPVVQTAYTYTWTIPIGISTIDPTYFVIQAEGYGPLTNVFHPCPSTWGSSTSSSGAFCTGEAPYDCKGQTLCSTTNVKFCDKAINNMQRGSSIYTSNGVSLAVSGNCWANYEGFGCSVQIRGTDENGKNCVITGDDMWDAYQDIRNIAGCAVCGSKHFGNGCLVSIDYYYDCDNRDPGPNRF